MPKDPLIREKFTKLRTAARQLAAEYFERYPKDRYRTELEGWRHLQSDNIEFTIKRLRKPIDADNRRGYLRAAMLAWIVRVRDQIPDRDKQELRRAALSVAVGIEVFSFGISLKTYMASPGSEKRRSM